MRNQPEEFGKNTKQGQNGSKKDKCGKMAAKYEEKGQSIIGRIESGGISKEAGNRQLASIQKQYETARKALGC